jgi:hypothetical protein
MRKDGAPAAEQVQLGVCALHGEKGPLPALTVGSLGCRPPGIFNQFASREYELGALFGSIGTCTADSAPIAVCAYLHERHRFPTWNGRIPPQRKYQT